MHNLFPTLLDGLQAITVRFEIPKAKSSGYGREFWKVFWECFEPGELRTSELFEGDSPGTLRGREDVFCIGIRNLDSRLPDIIRQAFLQHPEFEQLAAQPPFVTGAECLRGLATAGRIDPSGELIGTDAGWPRTALGEVRIARRKTSATCNADAAKRAKPASVRTAKLPHVDSFDEFDRRVIGWQGVVKDPLTPEELCDVVEEYAELIAVHVEEYSCFNSQSMLRVSVMPRTNSDCSGRSFIGMYPFGSPADAVENCRSRCGFDAPSEVIEKLMTQRGIQGKWHRNFEGYDSVTLDEVGADGLVEPHNLWTLLSRRAEQLEMPLLTCAKAKRVVVQPHPPDGLANLEAALAAEERLSEIVRKDAQRKEARRNAPPQSADDARSFRFTCEHCGKTLRAKLSDVGRAGRCKHCGCRVRASAQGQVADSAEMYEIPSSSETASSRRSARATASADAVASDAQAASFRCECPNCGARVNARREHIGRSGRCPRCHRTVRITDPM